MKYDKLKKLSNEEFKRATGVKRKTFEIMLFEVNKAENKRKLKAKGRGRKPNLTIEDEIIMTLEYLREYRTMFHIGVDYGVNESRVCRIGKKEFQKTDVAFEVVLVDATESPIERPKKNKNNSIVERKRSIH